MDARELKQYERFKDEAQCLRAENQHLRQELCALRPQAYRDGVRIGQLEERIERLDRENKSLKAKLADLTEKLQAKPKPAPPAFVKANTPVKRAKKPGRKPGHAPSLRPMPETIDVHQTVPLSIDAHGRPSCPACHAHLSEVKHHQRVVEEIIPAKVITTCYHTTSGYCAGCRKVVESRAADQPPAADVPHAQLGLNALATAAVMRVCYRLPLRQVARLLGQLLGLKVSPGGIVKQINRLGKWLEKQYHRLKLVLRAAGVVHADETGWRTNGRNGYLWTLTNADCTVYHIDKSRSGEVIAELLGKAFGQDGQTLVSDFYNVYDKFGPRQQKCLTHLLRELRDTVAKRPELSDHEFFKRCKRLTQDMLKLKRQWPDMTREAYDRGVSRMERRMDDLAGMTWEDADADRLTRRLVKYRRHLTTFLHKPEVDGTNNAAERAIRPVVVMRKITGGSRSAAGAKSFSILSSVMRTIEQQGRDVLETIKTLMRAEWAGQDICLLTDPPKDTS